ncbi:MAG: hypothetical protein WEB60_02980 [Terrimicrobiaceae bacterium]
MIRGVMCAAFEFQGRGFRPGKEVSGAGLQGVKRHVWAGFARVEILDWWQRKGGVLLDIPASRFAERSGVTGKLIWDGVPQGLVLRALLDTQTQAPLIKVVTRASTPQELSHFQHPRMPLLEKPLFPNLTIPPEAEPGLLF